MLIYHISSSNIVEMFYAKLPPIGREEFADSQYFVYREEELTSKVLTILTFLIDYQTSICLNNFGNK